MNFRLSQPFEDIRHPSISRLPGTKSYLYLVESPSLTCDLLHPAHSAPNGRNSTSRIRMYRSGHRHLRNAMVHQSRKSSMLPSQRFK